MSSTLALKFNKAKLKLDLTNQLNQSNYMIIYLEYYKVENTISILVDKVKPIKAKLKVRAYAFIKA